MSHESEHHDEGLQPGEPCLICGQLGAAPICSRCARVAAVPHVCAHCGEPIRPVPASPPDPADPADVTGNAMPPAWSHTDGSPLCPIPTNGGEQPGRPEPATDWPITGQSGRAEPAAADSVAPLVALTELLMREGFVPDDDHPAATSGIVAYRGSLRVHLIRDDGIAVELYGPAQPGVVGGGWWARFSAGTPVPVISAAIRAALRQ